MGGRGGAGGRDIRRVGEGAKAGGVVEGGGRGGGFGESGGGGVVVEEGRKGGVEVPIVALEEEGGFVSGGRGDLAEGGD